MVYDLDGTLIDTGEDIAAAVNHMLAAMNAPLLSRQQISAHVGRGLHHLIASCLGTADIKCIERGAALYRRYYQEHMLDHSRPYPGVCEFLNFFSDRAQVVMTNKPNPFADEMLSALGITQFLKEVIAGNSGYPKKPDPKALTGLLQKHELAATQAAVIGDSAIDIELARRAGVPVFTLTHGFTGREDLERSNPDGIFENFTELLEFAIKEKW